MALFCSPVRHAAMLAALLCLAAPSRGVGGEDLRIVASQAPGWPQFRGPSRDGVSAEAGLLPSWPAGGPPLLWQTNGIGRGYSSPILSGDGIYINGDVGQNLVVWRLNPDGSARWRTTNGRFWEKPYPGARATCTFDEGRLYTMNAHGRLACLDAATGSEQWAVDILERFGAKNIQWGISECVVIDRERVIVCPGGPQCMVAALDKLTGETVWASEPLRFTRAERPGGKSVDPPVEDIDSAGYASPVLLTIGGRRLLAGASGRHFFIVDADAGKLLWTQLVPTMWEVLASMPVVCGDGVVFSAPDAAQTRRVSIGVGPGGFAFRPSWQAPVDNCHGGFVAVAGRLYGAGYRRGRGWVCLDAATGAALGTAVSLPQGSAVYADGRLYALSETGVVSLFEPSPAGLRVVGQFQIPVPPGVRTPQRDVWAHPVVFEGRLYLRNHDLLLCYDVRDAKKRR